MTLNERLIAVSDLWAKANGRSTARLATIVANDGKMIERLRGGAGCTVVVAERFFEFFRDPTKWRGGSVPNGVGDLLDGVDLGAAAVHDDEHIARPLAPSAGTVEAASRREASHA